MKKSKFIYHYIFLIVSFLIGVIYTSVNLYPDVPILTVHSSKGGQSLTANKLMEIVDSGDHSIFKKTKISSETDGSSYFIVFPSVDQQMLAKDYINAHYKNKYIASPNLHANYPKWLSYLGAEPMKLGLDLRGGVHLTLNVDVANSVLIKNQSSAADIIKKIQSYDLDYDTATKSNDGVTLSFSDANSAESAAKALNQSNHVSAKATNHTVFVSLAANSSTYNSNYIMQKTLESIHRRVNELGLSEAVIQRQGDTQINIDLPGIQDMQRAKDIIGNTATLSFHIVSSFDPSADSSPTEFSVNHNEGYPVSLYRDSILTGDAITFAVATSEKARPIIQIQLAGGAQEESFHTATAENVGKNLAIVYQETLTHPVTKERTIQKKVLSHPTIKQALRGSFIIEGMRSYEEAETLALLLRSGSLAAPIDIVHETTVGPSLGEDNIQKGLFSITVGFGVVVVFMTIYYRVFGIIANLGLLYNLVLIVACLSFLDATMSLPSMAAIVLTVGMAVDANVLIYERIREELRLGSAAGQAIAFGYEKAFATILDANITTFIVSIVLYTLGSGMIKGFAITLIIGLVCSMISSVYATRIITHSIQSRIHNLHAAIGI